MRSTSLQRNCSEPLNPRSLSFSGRKLSHLFRNHRVSVSGNRLRTHINRRNQKYQQDDAHARDPVSDNFEANEELQHKTQRDKHAVVDDVSVGFYVEASSHTEASKLVMKRCARHNGVFRGGGLRLESLRNFDLPIPSEATESSAARRFLQSWTRQVSVLLLDQGQTI